MELNSEGRAVVHVGSASIGQGVETVLAQICADGLGVGYDDVAEVRHGDTDTVPDGMGSFGSRATAIAGSAVLRAAEALRESVIAAAAEVLEASESDLEIADGRVAARGSPIAKRLAWPSCSRPLSRCDALAASSDPWLSEEAYFHVGSMTFPYGVHLAAVEVDTETGASRSSATRSRTTSAGRSTPS